MTYTQGSQFKFYLLVQGKANEIENMFSRYWNWLKLCDTKIVESLWDWRLNRYSFSALENFYEIDCRGKGRFGNFWFPGK